MRSIVVAGVTSGVGKTTIACALMAAYRQRGRRVQPFKTGPDYIDPSHHAAAAGTPSRNLDTVLMPEANMRALYRNAASDADIALVEGVMGLFDGRNGRGEEGSTAQVAKLLGAPVIAVLDVARTARTAGAIALGMARFDPALPIVGFVLNRVASPSHGAMARDAVEAATGLPVLGLFPRDPELGVPERYLGLIPTRERRPDDAFFARLAAQAAAHLDLDRIWTLASDRTNIANRESAEEAATVFPDAPIATKAAIAVARDEAFNFYYEDNLDLLRAWGAELLEFSPLADSAIPEGAQGVYIGGGFPELFAGPLSQNRPMLDDLRRAASAGLPIYGECGGLMYLAERLVDQDEHRYEMAGLVPLTSVMREARLTLGYRDATALQASPVLPRGRRATGHVFHYSQLAEPVPADSAAYRLEGADPVVEGYVGGNVLASYVHLHFGGDPRMAPRFTSVCAAQEPLRRE